MKKKCYYYDNGYCKLKEHCVYYHPTSECQIACSDKKTCRKRHRRLCKFKSKCYFKVNNKCEYIHNTDVTLAEDDNEHMKAQEVILAAHNQLKDIQENILNWRQKIKLLLKRLKY